MDQYANTVSGLKRRRGDLEREMVEVRERLASLSNEIDAVDRVLAGLGEAAEPVTTRTPRIVLFYRNELRQFILRLLREEGRLMSSRDIAERIVALDGKDAHDKRLMCDIVRRVSKACRQLRDRGVIDSLRDSAGRVTWSLKAT